MYVCTECDTFHKTEARAAKCHWGIGGVMTEDEWRAEIDRWTPKPGPYRTVTANELRERLDTRL